MTKAERERADAKRMKAEAKAYVAALSPSTRRVVKQLAAIIAAQAPEATPYFSYGIPGFRSHGKALLWYAGWTHHVSLYPVTPAMKRAAGARLATFKVSKGTLQFPLDTALPVSFISKLVRARVAEVRTA